MLRHRQLLVLSTLVILTQISLNTFADVTIKMEEKKSVTTISENNLESRTSIATSNSQTTGIFSSTGNIATTLSVNETLETTSTLSSIGNTETTPYNSKILKTNLTSSLTDNIATKNPSVINETLETTSTLSSIGNTETTPYNSENLKTTLTSPLTDNIATKKTSVIDKKLEITSTFSSIGNTETTPYNSKSSEATEIMPTTEIMVTIVPDSDKNLATSFIASTSTSQTLDSYSSDSKTNIFNDTVTMSTQQAVNNVSSKEINEEDDHHTESYTVTVSELKPEQINPSSISSYIQRNTVRRSINNRSTSRSIDSGSNPVEPLIRSSSTSSRLTAPSADAIQREATKETATKSTIGSNINTDVPTTVSPTAKSINLTDVSTTTTTIKVHTTDTPTTTTDIPNSCLDWALQAAVKNILVKKTNETHVLYTWDKLIDQCSTVKYNVTFKYENGNKDENITTNYNNLTIAMQQVCENITVTVTAFEEESNKAGPENKQIVTIYDEPEYFTCTSFNATADSIEIYINISNNAKCLKKFIISTDDPGITYGEIDNKNNSAVYKLTGLMPCSTYDITVTAELKNGSSGNKACMLKFNTSSRDLPPPSGLMIKNIDLHSVELSWNSVERTNCPNGYYVNVTSDENNIIHDGQNLSKSEISTTINKLKSCKKYNVTIYSYTSYKQNEDNEKVVGHIYIDSAPPNPKIHAFNISSTSSTINIKYNLTDSQDPENECPVTKIEVSCKSIQGDSDNRRVKVEAKIGQENIADAYVPNLISGTSYTCTLILWNNKLSNDYYIGQITTTQAISAPLVIFLSALFALLSVVILFAIIFILRRRNPEWYRKLVITVFGDIPTEQVVGACPRPPSAIRTEVFEEHCSALAQPSGVPGETGFIAQFKLVNALSPLPVAAQPSAYKTGQIDENRIKNRYINILPYDVTRVKISEIDDDPSTDYINANFVKGYTDEIEYIASQGPKEETCEDFWRMVFEHDVKIIAMVTNLKEKGTEKCHQYYPNLRETSDFGYVSVKCTSEVNLPIYSRRNLLVVKDGLQKSVLHLHFREWPDFGCPASTDLMIDFCNVIRQQVKQNEGLVLVHCSAGVGRTGTLIAVDILMQHIKQNNKIDVFGTVLKLREQRINMVQTANQFTYIHYCIRDALQDPLLLNHDISPSSSVDPICINTNTEMDSFIIVGEGQVSISDSESHV